MKKKVLAIDADPFSLTFLKATLEAVGYRVLTALDGESGLEKFYVHQPDLVILEVTLPHLNGWAVCRRIRSQSTIPILIHTTVETPEYLLQAVKVGASDFLVKPVLPQIIQDKVDVRLKSQAPQEPPHLLSPRVEITQYA